MAKKKNIEDDLAKAIAKAVAKMFKNQAPPKVRYEIQSSLKGKVRGAYSRLEDNPRLLKNKPTTKGPKGPVPKPDRPEYKGGGLIQNESQARGATRRSNRTLRNEDDLKPQSKPDRMPQSPDVPQAGKRSKSRGVGSRSRYEADDLRRNTAADRKKYGKRKK